jgi:hypothetical protein
VGNVCATLAKCERVTQQGLSRSCLVCRRTWNRVVERKFDVGEVNIRWSGEEEKPAGISKKKCALVVRKCKFSHVETKLYLCMMNTGRNRFAVYMEMLQFKGFRLARKHNTYIC